MPKHVQIICCLNNTAEINNSKKYYDLQDKGVRKHSRLRLKNLTEVSLEMIDVFLLAFLRIREYQEKLRAEGAYYTEQQAEVH